MVRITVTEKEITLLRRVCGEKFTKFFPKMELSMRYDDIEEISDLISEFFLKKGIGRYSEPNILGFELETLLDKFIKNDS